MIQSNHFHDKPGPPDIDISLFFFLFPPAVDGRDAFEAALSGGGPAPAGWAPFPVPPPKLEIDPPDPVADNPVPDIFVDIDMSSPG